MASANSCMPDGDGRIRISDQNTTGSEGIGTRGAFPSCERGTHKTKFLYGRADMSGKTDEIKGRVKKAVGELTGNDKLKREGEIDKVAGKVKKGVDKVKDALQGKNQK
jgi:uncharacterized protein YjbJ (UPF0337 family)